MMRLDAELSEEQTAFRDTIRDFIRHECPEELMNRCDLEGLYPAEIYKQMGELGWLAAPFPEKYGGGGGSPIDLIILAEELAMISVDLATVCGEPIFVGLNILEHGSEEQKEQYLSALGRGEIRFSVGITEPDAGSDAGSMKTQGIVAGETIHLEGEKVFCSGADLPDTVIMVMCRTSSAPKHREAFTAVLVDAKLEGISTNRLNPMGRRMIGTTQLRLDNVAVPLSSVLGQVNSGWEVLISGLAFERLFCAASYVGSANAIVEEACSYARERKQFGRPIGDFQAISHMLADVRTETDVARTFVYAIARRMANGESIPVEVAKAKLFASEVLVRAAHVGTQVFGGYGYMMDTPINRHFRDARLATISGGSSQMQRNAIARSLGFKT